MRYNLVIQDHQLKQLCLYLHARLHPDDPIDAAPINKYLDAISNLLDILVWNPNVTIATPTVATLETEYIYDELVGDSMYVLQNIIQRAIELDSNCVRIIPMSEYGDLIIECEVCYVNAYAPQQNCVV